MDICFYIYIYTYTYAYVCMDGWMDVHTTLRFRIYVSGLQVSGFCTLKLLNIFVESPCKTYASM